MARLRQQIADMQRQLAAGESKEAVGATAAEPATEDAGDRRSLEQLETIKRTLLAQGTLPTDHMVATVEGAIQDKKAQQMAARPMSSQLGETRPVGPNGPALLGGSAGPDGQSGQACGAGHGSVA